MPKIATKGKKYPCNCQAYCGGDGLISKYLWDKHAPFRTEPLPPAMQVACSRIIARRVRAPQDTSGSLASRSSGTGSSRTGTRLAQAGSGTQTADQSAAASGSLAHPHAGSTLDSGTGTGVTGTGTGTRTGTGTVDTANPLEDIAIDNTGTTPVPVRTYLLVRNIN